MKKFIHVLLTSVFTLGIYGSLPSTAAAEDTEEQFQELFVTAGYSTAFGAALGAAALGLTKDPSSNLRYVYFGASLGFIAGSVMGTYLILSPTLVRDTQNINTDVLAVLPTGRGRTIAVRPIFNVTARRFSGLQAGITLVSF